MELLETVAVEIAFGDEKMDCPFPHEEVKHDKKNKIPPDVTNSSASLGTALVGKGMRVKVAKIAPPFRFKSGKKASEAGFSPHHVIPGNEMWNDKGHPLHAWIHKAKEKVKGDIGYENNSGYNGIDLPSHHKVAGWGAMEATDPLGQVGYACAAMSAAGSQRQFHDAHKAYSDMVWNALENISKKLDAIVDKKGCGNKRCLGTKKKKYDPPYGVLDQLKGVVGRLRTKLSGAPTSWQPPIVTSRFAVLYANGGKDQEKARQVLEAMRDKMGRPTDQ